MPSKRFNHSFSLLDLASCFDSSIEKQNNSDGNDNDDDDVVDVESYEKQSSRNRRCVSDI